VQHNRHLRALTNPVRVPPDPAPTAEQLEFGAGNHFDRMHRLRDLAAAVLDGTYPGRGGRQRPYEARHREVLWWIGSHAGRDGIARMSVYQLANQLGREPSNVRHDVRDLVAGGFVVPHPRPGDARRYDYFLPALRHPASLNR
jgi:hypothetical protein